PDKPLKRPKAELYDRARYLTVTGNRYGDYRQLQHAQTAIDALYESLAADAQNAQKPPAQPRMCAVQSGEKDYLAIGLVRDETLAALWRGDRPNGNESSDDLALMNKLAYWCNCDPERMEAAFCSSPYYGTKDGEHLKKASRADYLKRTIACAMQSVTRTAGADDAAHQQAQTCAASAQTKPDVLHGFYGKYISLTALRAALSAYHLLVRFNLISGEIEIEGLPAAYSGQNTTEILPTFLFDALKAAGVRGVTKQILCDYIFAIADENRYNPVADLLKNITWDGVDRFPTLFEILGIEQVPRYQTYLRKWCIQCVSMAFNSEKRPYGADGVLVLQGEQGLGKTSFFRKLALYDAWFVEGASIDTDNKDSLIKATSAWMVELGELDSTLRKEQAALKSHITAATDIIRAPYAKTATKRPRRTSYCGTVNPTDYLRDETGSRRFWTIHIDRLDLNRLRGLSDAFMRQIWAQSTAQFRKDANAFRLTREEMQCLNTDNIQFAKLLPFEQEVLDNFNFEMPSEQWKWLTASDISARTTAGRASATQIGHVLNKLIDSEKRMDKKRSNGKTTYLVPLTLWR
ncbi:MAG: VapE family protein, partial [Ruthenibacterium sp.]